LIGAPPIPAAKQAPAARAPRAAEEQLGTLEHRGCRLAYRLAGQGPPVLLVQGTGLHGEGWRPQVEGLVDRHRCLWFDNRGVGASVPAGAKITIEQMAEDAVALMDAAGFADAHVVGHSLGGVVAQQVALAARGRVRSLSLLCTMARGRDALSLSPSMLWLGLRTYVGTRRARRRAFLEMVVPPATLGREDRDGLAERLAPLFGHDLADHPPVVMKQLAALRAFDATPRLAELAGISTMVLVAALDRIARPELGRALAGGIPGARLVELADAAHGVPLEQPERVNALLAAHFQAADRG